MPSSWPRAKAAPCSRTTELPGVQDPQLSVGPLKLDHQFTACALKYRRNYLRTGFRQQTQGHGEVQWLTHGQRLTVDFDLAPQRSVTGVLDISSDEG